MKGTIYAPKRRNTMNLLDNSSFLRFIAQAGIGGSHGNQAYAGDRWKLVAGTVSGAEREDGRGYDGITLNGTIEQIVPDAPQVATPFVEMVSGSASIAYDAEAGKVSITSAGGVLKHAMLLAGAWDMQPEYTPKGYAEELVECQRYFLRFDTGGPNSAAAWLVGIAWNETSARAILQTPVKMKSTPEIAFKNIRFLQIFPRSITGASGNFVTCVVTGARALYSNPNLYLNFTLSGATPGAHGFIAANDDNSSHIDLIADL